MAYRDRKVQFVRTLRSIAASSLAREVEVVVADDASRAEERLEDLLARNDDQGQMLGLDGTPGFIIGSTQSFGGMTLEQLEESVRTARSETAAAASDGRATAK